MKRDIFIFEDDENRIVQFKKFLGKDNLTITDNIDKAKKYLKENKYHIALLDHDMDHASMVESTERNTGYQVALFICQENISFDQIIVHSHNPVGAENMMNVLNKYAYNVPAINRIPFSDLVSILKLVK